MLSWRCPAHPAAGGAEVLTADVLRRWVRSGHEITWFSAAVLGAPREEVVDGIRHVRIGRQWTVHVQAWRWLRKRRHEFDRVIDQINTIPFFTPLYLRPEQRRFLIFQLAREYWWRETRGVFRLVAPVGYVLEPLYLRAYRSTDGVTISQSTRDDLQAVGIPGARISVMPMALDCRPLETLGPKPDGLTVVMLGRLTPAKFVEEGVLAFARIWAAVPAARLDIIGSGDPGYRSRLETRVEQLGLRGAVRFHGRVEPERRQSLLEGAHVHLFASHREGWGLVVSEAGAAGTPSVGYDAHGVRDSIADRSLLAPIGDVEALADRVLELQNEPARYEAARRSAWQRVRGLSGEAAARAFEAALE
jgi:glycosyltransferase involved in cell wall biosynthesis